MKDTSGKILYPLGGAAYLYKKDESLLRYLHSQLRKKKVKISIGAQPNSSPHIGTIVVFCSAFALAKLLKQYDNTLEISVLFEMVDTAPGMTKIIDGKQYQVSIKQSGELEKYLGQYYEILEQLSNFSDIPYEVRRQEEFNKHIAIPDIVKKVIDNREILAPILEPENNIIRIRVACPVCGLTDKQGVSNEFIDGKLICNCPIHGRFETDINKEPERLEYNTPLRNLIRAIVYSIDNQNDDLDYEWIRLTGSDYAGFYQEQTLYRAVELLGYSVSKLPIILYTPLIVDWSGAKLSKSLFKDQNYDYLPDFVMDYEIFKKEKGVEGLEQIFKEVLDWVKKPYKFFRCYSIEYFLKEVLKE